jgi:hypothetical protein
MRMLAQLPQAARLAMEAVSPVLALEPLLAALSGPQAAALAADTRGDRSLAARTGRSGSPFCGPAGRLGRRRLEPDRQAHDSSTDDQL